MPDPYIPPGFTGVLAGLIMVAMGRNPERWNTSVVPASEQKVWFELPSRPHPEMLEERLLEAFLSDPDAYDTAPMRARIDDFRQAQRDLRVALGEELLHAYFHDDAGRREFVLTEGWRTGAAEQILATGYALLDGLNEPQFLLVPGWELLNALVPGFASGPPLRAAATTEAHPCGTTTDVTGLPAAILPTKASAEEVFRAWVRQHEGRRPPSREADLAHMRNHFSNIKRDGVRDMRNEFAPEWSKPGRKSGRNPGK